MKKSLLLAILVVLGTCWLAQPLFAQTTQASIFGVIYEKDNAPLPGATVQIKNESTGFTTGTVTNAKGEYSFKELPLGGPYLVRATFVGYGEQKRTGYMLNQGDAIRVNLTMQEGEQSLQVVEVVASGLKNKIEDIGTATAISAKAMLTLPVNGRNYRSLMDLSPLSRGDNLSGQLASSTNFTIDGMTAKNPTSAGATTSRSGAPYSISMEAIREFKVVTNQYDVTFGRAGGGTVSVVTKAGTNKFTGSIFNYTRANWLSSPYDIRGNKRDAPFSTNQYGFSLGGPIIKDKLHFFMVWDHQQDSRPLIIADIRTATDESRFNVTTATLDQYITIARNKYGMSPEGRQYGNFDKKRGSDAAFARIDWQINNKHLLTLRNNFTSDVNKLGLADNTAINLYESYGNDYNVDNSLLATLRSTLNPRMTNELKLQHLYTYQKSSPGDQLPGANIPRAIVENVASTLTGGRNATTNIQMGGHRFAQERFRNNVIQLVDNLYYNTDKVQYTFGFDVMYTNAYSVYGSEVNGRFHYNAEVDPTTGGTITALENFNNLKPYRYYREVPLMDDWGVTGKTLNAGIYGQMQTKIARGLDMTAGLRLDYTHYPSSPLNQDLLNELGIRTDNKLKAFVVQPRLQFTWDVNERHTDYVRFGGGVFASDINNYMVINNLTFDGKHLATVDVRGANVPRPDFNAYRNNYGSIPSLAQFQLPTINTYGPDVRIPVVYKANLSYSRFLTDRLRVGIAGYMSLGRNNYTYVDRNMAVEPFFRLSQEGNRGVYVPLNSMPTSGVPDWLEGRISKKYGRVLELVSEGKVNQFAFVADATYRYFRDGEITASYTWNDIRDNTSFNGNVANSATLSLPVVDDPRNLSRVTYSDGHFRSKVVFAATLPSFYGITIGVRYSGIGGTRYSMLSGANNNGDFVGTNDLAYIFSRTNGSVPENVRTGLQAILDNPDASQSIKNYILKYEGKIAERNGGINGFYGTFDVRANKKFKLYKNHALEISADVFNFSNLLNKNWGVTKTLGTQTLYGLQAAGFDKTAARFNYRVNTAGVVNPSGNPYQIQLGARYSF